MLLYAFNVADPSSYPAQQQQQITNRTESMQKNWQLPDWRDSQVVERTLVSLHRVTRLIGQRQLIIK